MKDYIEFFGGDPARVTVMGQGSGGSAASVMALSSEGRNSQGVVALSGTALSPGTIRPDPAKHTRQLAKRTGCPETPVERLVLCLRKQSAEKIVLVSVTLYVTCQFDIVFFFTSISMQISIIYVGNLHVYFLIIAGR